MSRRTVTTQAQLDKALAEHVDEIIIDSPSGVWLRIVASGSSHVVARDSSHVEARGSSHVEARDSSHVEAWGSSHVEAWGSSHVEAWGSSHVEAWGSSHVEASGSSHVEAWGSSHVEARDSSHVVASKYVAVHLHSQHVTLSGGVVIDMIKADPTKLDDWLALTGVQVQDGHVTLYKATDRDLMAGRSYIPTSYAIGTEVTCPDWRDDSDCGGGLHVSPTPAQAAGYAGSDPRFLACRVAVEDIRCIDTSKVKCRKLTVLHEVDRFGEPVSA